VEDRFVMPHQHSVFSRSRLLLIAACLLPFAAVAGEGGGVPLDALLSAAAAPQSGWSSVLNEDGVVEANVARVRDGVVHLEFEAPADSPYTAAR